MQREKRTYSGPLLEVDLYPVFSDGRKLPTRAPKTKLTQEQQKKYNRLVAQKKLIRLVNENFDGSDYFMHPTYEAMYAPFDEKAARRDIVNYLRKIKRMRESKLKRLRKDLKEAKAAVAAMPGNAYLARATEELQRQVEKLARPFKYIYAIEKQIYKTGAFAGLVNYHFHLFATGGLTSAEMERAWKKGIRCNCNRFQPDTFGPEAAAKYMSKDPQGVKSFSYSRNLSKPKERVKDGKISKHSVEKIAQQRMDDCAYWEKKYKGYRFLRCYSRYNEYNGHWYVTAVMYKTGGSPPRWEESEWNTESL